MAHFGQTGLRGDDYERFDFGFSGERGAGMTKFEERNGELYIDGKKVIRAWESFSGWYWFAVEFVQKQDSIINDRVYPNDTIWYGLVQGLVEEWAISRSVNWNFWSPIMPGRFRKKTCPIRVGDGECDNMRATIVPMTRGEKLLQINEELESARYQEFLKLQRMSETRQSVCINSVLYIRIRQIKNRVKWMTEKEEFSQLDLDL